MGAEFLATPCICLRCGFIQSEPQIFVLKLALRPRSASRHPIVHTDISCEEKSEVTMGILEIGVCSFSVEAGSFVERSMCTQVLRSCSFESASRGPQ